MYSQGIRSTHRRRSIQGNPTAPREIEADVKKRTMYFFYHGGPRSTNEFTRTRLQISLYSEIELEFRPAKQNQCPPHYKNTASVTCQTIRIKREKKRDISYEGWPNSRSECLLPSGDFCNLREDLTFEYRIILKCDRIVVPSTLRPDILDIHGVKKYLRRARSAVHWPGITNDITQFVRRGEAC